MTTTSTPPRHQRSTATAGDVELPVVGMTCQSCVVRVTKHLRAVPGVRDVRVSVRRGQARVRTRRGVSRAQLVAAVRSAGYDVGADTRHWFSRDGAVWRDLVLAIGAVVILAYAARGAGLTGLAGRLSGVATSGSLAMVVLLGVAAGLSTCMALVGGLVLALSARHAQQSGALTTAQRLRPHLMFNLGRVVGFGVLGAVLGAIGSAVTLKGRALAVVMVVVALVMVGVGLRLTEVSPRLTRAGSISLPAGLATALGLDQVRGRYRDSTAVLSGVGSFLLPCGFTQAVQVYALSTGSPVTAGAIMALFALGTVPGLLGVGGLVASVRGDAATRFFRFAGVVVLAFAAINLSGAAAVLAPGLVRPPGAAAAQPAASPTAVQRDADPSSPPGAQALDAPTPEVPTQEAPESLLSDNVTLDGDVQVVRTTQVAEGYVPADTTIYKDRKVRWEITATALTCAASLWAPDLGIEPVEILPGQSNVFEFTPTRVGTLSFTCGMGMFGGRFIVVSEP